MRKCLLLFVLILLIASCSESDLSNQDKDAEVTIEDYKITVTPNNYLAFKLLEHLEANDDKNIFISPTSLFFALSMVYQGAEGETKDEIANVLNIKDLSQEELNRANEALMLKLMNQIDPTELGLANSIWLNENFRFQEQFKHDSEKYYDAKINEIDIKDRETVNEINDWVSENTNEKIEEIVQSPLSEDLVILLINTLYFQGNWYYEFDKSLTEDHSFTNSEGDTADVPLMTIEEELPYIENDVFQAVSLPYDDEKMTMDIYLPQKNVTLEELKDELTGGRWEDWNRQFRMKEGTVLVPKFELAYDIELNSVLKKLGMKNAFTKNANLSHMIEGDDNLRISDVRQKTYIDVNEQGTEAAAATSVAVVEMSAIDEQPFYMEINRPFLFVIKDYETNMILLIGQIENPN